MSPNIYLEVVSTYSIMPKGAQLLHTRLGAVEDQDRDQKPVWLKEMQVNSISMTIASEYHVRRASCTLECVDG
jgi:hypothetical protein